MVLTTMLPAFSMQAVQSLTKQKYGKAAVWLKKKNRKKESESACLRLSLVRDHIHRGDSQEQTGLRMWMVAETS